MVRGASPGINRSMSPFLPVSTYRPDGSIKVCTLSSPFTLSTERLRIAEDRIAPSPFVVVASTSPEIDRVEVAIHPENPTCPSTLPSVTSPPIVTT